MLSAQEIEMGLRQHYGTSQYFTNPILTFQYTDGVKYLWESAECYWLLIAISSHKRTEPFQVWTLTVNDDNSAVLTMKEDSGRPNIVTQEIPFTDFPLKEVELWLIDGVLILPSEY